jgi:hypothetical protein
MKVDERMKFALTVSVLLGLPLVCVAEETVRFDRDVRPLLSDRCFHCHGPNEHDRQAGLRLDQGDGDEGAYQVIEPESLEDSELWYRVTSEDDDVMPPPDSSKKPLSDSEKRILRRWIEQGAEYSDFWAFVPPRRSEIPEVADARWNQQPIDRLVFRRLKAEGMAPNPMAGRRTLIRRLSFDLTGLPPRREEIHRYLNDSSPDAYERLVDRMLAKPQFGEHMTKYWLDLVRFADTNGIHHDHFREMTPYRDWVIRAFNDNLPYDDFVRYQLAGDLLPDATQDQLIASGFNRLHLIIDRGTALPEESYTRNVVDRVTAVGTAFMGLTVQCAVCHDHKYDPLTMKDFYQLFAFFNNLDGNPETGGRQGLDFERGLQPPYISLATEAQKEDLAALASRVDEAKKRVDALEKALQEADETTKETLDAELKEAKQAFDKAQAEKKAFEITVPVAMVMKEKADRRQAHILIRGAYDNPGKPVERDTPGFLPPMKPKEGLKTRLDLANWFVSAENPLTARVAVNRFWQQVFGVGIVKTSEDFGAQGEWPSHPDLLDYLAHTFVESGWDVKALMKQIVMSETYKQSSSATPDQFEADPENRMLARGSRFRMDAEVLRDMVLATSGLLNVDMFGKSVKPPQPPGLWESVSMPSSYPRVYQADGGDKIYRRSVYTFWKRGMPPPQMTILNAPTREACIARRERTNTPLQALLLMNEPEYLKAARYLARTTIQKGPADCSERLAVLFETILSRPPDKEEEKVFLDMVGDLRTIYDENAELADSLCEGVSPVEGSSKAELATWTMLVSTIYNLDIAKVRD